MVEQRQGVLLLADFSAAPVWECDINDPRDHVNIDVEDLPLLSETMDRLHGWADKYEHSIDWGSPERTEWTPAEYALFDQEGVELWHLLRKELEPTYKVFYFSERLKRFFADPDELAVALLAVAL